MQEGSMEHRDTDCLVFRLCENAPYLLREVLEELGWREFSDEDEEGENWNLWWKTSAGFRMSDFEYCRPWQRLNHFPKSCLITRKDSLARNLRKMRGIHGGALYNFAPMAFNLPNDYKKFVTEYSRQKEGRRNVWICKPADQSRGRGIFLFRELADLTYNCATVVQKYISNPLLISGYKFDLRLYVLVTSFHPFTVYIYHEGLVRFSTEKFDLASTDNVFSHLTNTSINKLGPSYSAEKGRVGIGCKWSLNQLRIYFHQHSVDDRLLWHRITAIIILTLLIQAPEVPNNRSNCFELYGFDVLVDENMKPWLLEVNFSPALGNDCPLDVTVKKPMLHDIVQALRFTEADVLHQKPRTDKSASDTPRKNKSTKQKPSLSRSLRVNKYNFCSSKSEVQAQDSDSKPLDMEGSGKEYMLESDACWDLNGNQILKTEQGIVDACQYEEVKCKEAMLCGTRLDSSSGNINGTTESNTSTMADLTNNNCQKLQLSKTNASCQFLAAFDRDQPNKPVQGNPCSACDPSQTASIGLALGDDSSICKPLQNYELGHPRPGNLIKDEIPPSAANKNCSNLNKGVAGKSTRSECPGRLSSLTIRRGRSLIAPRTAGDLIQRRLSRTQRSRSSSSLLGSVTPRSLIADRLCSQFPSNRHRRSNCEDIRPISKFGNYILVFPFNESTNRANSQGYVNTKVIIEEIKLTLKKVTQNFHQTKTIRGKREERIEHLDLEKPFWGFRPMYDLK